MITVNCLHLNKKLKKILKASLCINQIGKLLNIISTQALCLHTFLSMRLSSASELRKCIQCLKILPTKAAH